MDWIIKNIYESALLQNYTISSTRDIDYNGTEYIRIKVHWDNEGRGETWFLPRT